MKKPILDHSWKSILNRDELSKICLKDKLKQLQEIAAVIQSNYDESTVINVMDNGKIIYALKRALEYLENPQGYLTEKDFFIYYSYASSEAKNTEKIIDDELAHLGL